MCRVGCHNLAGHKPIERHTDRGKVLLDRGLLEVISQALDIGCDMRRLDIGELPERMAVHSSAVSDVVAATCADPPGRNQPLVREVEKIAEAGRAGFDNIVTARTP